MSLELKPVDGFFDKTAQDIFEKAPNTRISWFLAASFAYYIEQESLFTDEFFDKLCVWLLEHYDEVTHRHKALVTPDMLRAGTAYNLRREDYPLIVQFTVNDMRHTLGVHHNML